MSLTDFLTARIAKRLKIPEEQVTVAFLDQYFKDHPQKLRQLPGSSLGGNIASRYLRQVRGDDTLSAEAVEEEQAFIATLTRH